ncbi:MAG: bifunctional folylpolyglutamate synthase/dihydrofolate synthase [Thermoplasmata archaeon]|nr:bifunctional folylpolyglutamate synthase/dihydrofolate synthase [Thermoplasmata archaeon]MCI4356698.1 bifunctional folylpolyglutamate synthase/dihydrofolate synthase [Thermoplasmata archaeon]
MEALAQRRRFGIRPGLETIRALLGALDHPELAFRTIHVAGSKGKGSVTAIAASVLQAVGGRVGRFTSPHLLSYRERIAVNARPIPPAAVVAGVARIESTTARLLRSGALEREPTFFEATTALAFDWFREQKVDAAVIEVGLGGRLDSTNVLDSPVGVITTIELEHVEILGPTLTAIAREKAGILHRGMAAFVGETKAEPLAEIHRIAGSLGVPVLHLGREIAVENRSLDEHGQTFDLTTPHAAYPKLRLPLHGVAQSGNAALAVAAVERFQEALDGRLSEAQVRRGLAKVRWRGRLERFGRSPEGWLDVAHTPESALALARSLAEINPLADPEGNAVVFGCLAEKRVDEILEALAPLAATLVIAPVRSARALEVAAIQRSAAGRFPRVVVAPDVATAWRLARIAADPEGFVLVTGSDYLVGDLIASVEGRPEDEPDLSDPGVARSPEAASP